MQQRSSVHLILLLPLLLPLCASTEDATPQGHLNAFGKQGPISGIDVVDGFLPPKEFIDNYVMQNKPVLFKGAAKLSPAFDKWTDEYFKSNVPPRPTGDVFIEHSKKENRSQSYNFIHFSKFLDTYNTSNIYMVSEVPQFVLQDLIVPFSLQCKNFLQGQLDTHVVWFSSGGTSSVIHNDAYENINCLYRGRKSLVFINTKKYQDQVKKIIDVEDGAYSSADVDKIDVVNRPEFRDLEFHEGVMNTGDCLYIPLFWVHQVRSFENNLAVNIWWPPRDSYQLDLCSPKPNDKLHFGKVYFKTIEETVSNDVNNARNVIDVNLADGRTEPALMKMLSGEDEKVAAMPEFASAVSNLFKAIDTNMDGKMSDAELRAPLKRKQFRPIYSALANYNVLVFRMHEEAGNSKAADDLPKLFRTSNSDDSVFAEHRTWRQVEPPAGADEGDIGDDEMQPPPTEEEARESEKQAEDGDRGKDEL